MHNTSSSSSSHSFFAANQHRLTIALKLATISISIIALYAQDLIIILNNALQDDASFHILAIPFLFSYFLYRKRKMVSAALRVNQPQGNFFQQHFGLLAGILLCATAIMTYWYGSYTFTPLEYHMVTLPVFVAGLTLVLFDMQVLKQLLFPIVFLIFLTPPPSEFLYGVGSALSNISATAANSIANLFGMASVLSDSYGSPMITLTRPDNSIMTFSVDVACSGIYSLIGFVIFSLFIAYITRGKFRNKFSILIIGIPLIILLNILRITTIVGIGYYYGDALALEVFHTFGATVLMFVGTLLLFVITEKLFKKPPPIPTCPSCNDSLPKSASPYCADCGKLYSYPKLNLRKADFVKIFSIALIVVALLSIQAPVFALTQGPAEVMVQTPSGEQGNTEILPQIDGYALSFVYRDTAFQELSGQDASLVYAYRPTNGSGQTIWVAVELATSMIPLHRWETCLVNYPLSQGMKPKVVQLDLRDVSIQDNPPLVARFFAFQYSATNQTQAVLYWYQTATFNVNETTQTMHVKMSIIAYPSSPADVPKAEAKLLPVALAVKNYWSPIQTWTVVSLAISQNGLTLSAASIVLLVAVIIYFILLSRQERNRLHMLLSKLAKQDQLVVDAFNNAQEHGVATTHTVFEEYQKLSDTTVTEDWIAQKLAEQENVGLLRRVLVNNGNDVPTIRWKSQILRFNFPFFSSLTNH
ncbi:MAG: exosortase/archaeosortase family protein [Candidatus Bathyarchaeota archaeon]|nr:exosortase/archaeosortase family protein [Candidatus Bathyarchaeota archaeon]